MSIILTDEEVLAILAGHGMTGDDARTALATWKSLDAEARQTHPDARRVHAALYRLDLA